MRRNDDNRKIIFFSTNGSEMEIGIRSDFFHRMESGAEGDGGFEHDAKGSERKRREKRPRSDRMAGCFPFSGRWFSQVFDLLNCHLIDERCNCFSISLAGSSSQTQWGQSTVMCFPPVPRLAVWKGLRDPPLKILSLKLFSFLSGQLRYFPCLFFPFGVPAEYYFVNFYLNELAARRVCVVSSPSPSDASEWWKFLLLEGV